MTEYSARDGVPRIVPVHIHRAVKALAADEKHRVALEFIINELGGRHRISFVIGHAESMVWLEGRRYVAEIIARLIEDAIPEVAEDLQPARTLTEKARRRAKPTT